MREPLLPPGAVPIHALDRGPWSTPAWNDPTLSRTERTFGLVGECPRCNRRLILMPLLSDTAELRCEGGCPPEAVAQAFLGCTDWSEAA